MTLAIHKMFDAKFAAGVENKKLPDIDITGEGNPPVMIDHDKPTRQVLHSTG